MHTWPRLALALALLAGGSSAARAETSWLIPPVDAAMVRAFEPGATEWSQAHRGIDYRVASGTAVRAAGSGVVSFAGDVAGLQAVTIDHASGMQSTYSRLGDILVTQGQHVDQGGWIGHAGEAHEGIEGLHFGVKLAGEYVDPLSYLGPLDVSGAVHLAPLRDPIEIAMHDDDCTDAVTLPEGAPAPNDNIAVAIAGIGSETVGEISADMYEYGPELLGYPADRIYRFSYAGPGGPRFHRPYEQADSSGSLVLAAARLRDLMVRIAHKHPGAEVDLIAHSQGGIVARAYLEGVAAGWSAELPPVEHLVTFATPHHGAPLADELPQLQEGTLTGGVALDGLSKLISGPDPNGAAIVQLQSGSALMTWLAREDLVYGTRALAMAMPHDAIVPADRALLETETTRVLRPEGLEAHSGIVRSPVARGVAHAFLRDAALPCKGMMDSVGPWTGRAVGLLTDGISIAYGAAETAITGPIKTISRLLP